VWRSSGAWSATPINEITAYCTWFAARQTPPPPTSRVSMFTFPFAKQYLRIVTREWRTAVDLRRRLWLRAHITCISVAFIGTLCPVSFFSLYVVKFVRLFYLPLFLRWMTNSCFLIPRVMPSQCCFITWDINGIVIIVRFPVFSSGRFIASYSIFIIRSITVSCVLESIPAYRVYTFFSYELWGACVSAVFMYSVSSRDV
jgi:hypothetical protein